MKLQYQKNKSLGKKKRLFTHNGDKREHNIKQADPFSQEEPEKLLDMYEREQEASIFTPGSQRSSRKYNCDEWELQQMKRLFDEVELHGTLWNSIQKAFPSRRANCLKNKFYGVIRKFLRGIFKVTHGTPGKQLKEISSKKLCLLYQGKKEFRDYKDFVRKGLEATDYKTKPKSLQNLARLQKEKINSLHNVLFQRDCTVERSSQELGEQQIRSVVKLEEPLQQATFQSSEPVLVGASFDLNNSALQGLFYPPQLLYPGIPLFSLNAANYPWYLPPSFY